MPVTSDLEPPDTFKPLMTPVNQTCEKIPYSHHKRWRVKTGVNRMLASQEALTTALQHTYSVRTLIETRNLPANAVLPDGALDTADSVSIDGDVHHEGDAVAVHGVVLALGCESDGDIHIDLAQSLSSTECLVVEVANPRDIDPSLPSAERQYVASMEAPLRRRFTEIYDSGGGEKPTQPFEMTVVGQLFFDTDHRQAVNPGGGRGIKIGGQQCARNLWEVHPILDIKE